MRKILALVLATAVCLSLATTAFATSGYQDGTSSNVDSTGSVKSEDVAKEVESAVGELVTAGKANSSAEVVIKNAASITPKALQDISAAASKAGGKVLLMADGVVGGKIESRLYINPAQATGLKEAIKLGVKLDDSSVQYTKSKFAAFANEIAVAKFEQSGAFGMTISVALRLDVSKMDTKNLKFYTYDAATNVYRTIAAPSYWFDKAGFIHFNTAFGDSIVISSGALTLKK